MTAKEFQTLLQEQGRLRYRDMPWRADTRDYYVVVSELMLQQTQVDRVVPKFLAFTQRFPDWQTLAQSSLADVLGMWQGLGYNRRAKYLHQTAQMVTGEYKGHLPRSVDNLVKLPGIGHHTAGAIAVYAYSQPEIFIETNIRTVYFHHFFEPHEPVDDKQILPLLQQTIDRDNPRAFYWALMDYGVYLKSQGLGNINQSRHYKKQSKLDGSLRQTRGQIIKALAQSSLSAKELERAVDFDERFDLALSDLLREGLVEYKNNSFSLGS